MSGSRNATAHLYGGRIGDGRPHTPSRPAPADGTPASTPGATPPLPPRSQGLSPTTGRATSQVSFADLAFFGDYLSCQLTHAYCPLTPKILLKKASGAPVKSMLTIAIPAS